MRTRDIKSVDDILEYRSSPITEQAIECLKHKLYVPGCYLKTQYELIRDGHPVTKQHKLIVVYIDDYSVGAILGAGPYIMVYVMKDFRRSGIATRLISRYARQARIRKDQLQGLEGIKGSGALYFANGIPKAKNTLHHLRAFGWYTVPKKGDKVTVRRKQ